MSFDKLRMIMRQAQDDYWDTGGMIMGMRVTVKD